MSIYDQAMEDRNYYQDFRVRAGQRRDDGALYDVNDNRMKGKVQLYDEEFEVPIHYEVCQTCDGRGKHVNPSIDAGGLSRDDFDEDPDFAESYFSGTYDVQCYGCGGKRIVPVIDEGATDPALLKRLHDHDQAMCDIRAEERAERMMGA